MKKFRRFYCLVFGLKYLLFASQKIHRIIAFDYSQYRAAKTIRFDKNYFLVTITRVKPIQHLTAFGNFQLLSQ